MKAMLYTAVEEAPSAESVEPEVISRHFASFDEVFFTFCDRELKKINTFYSGKRVLLKLNIYELNQINESLLIIFIYNNKIFYI